MKKVIKRFASKEFLILLGIFFLSSFLRLYKLGGLPYSLHQDEVMNGYAGRFILSNGRDLYGNRWPLLYFDRFNDYPNVIPMYLSGLSTFVFGVNEFAVRFPVALIGALAVFPIYYLALMIFRKKNPALFASFLLAILPWHLVLSRATAEGILGLTCFSGALALLIRAVESKNYRIFWIAGFGFFLTYFLYPSFRVITPLAFLPLPWVLVIKEKNFRRRLGFLLVFFFLLTLVISQTRWGQGRFKQTSLFCNEEVAGRLKANLEALSFDLGPTSILQARIFHNKVIAYGREFFSQYFSYFSPEFLFLKGGLPDRYKVPYQGLFYISLFLLLVAALLPTKAKVNQSFFIYFFYLLVIAPLPAALTVDDVPNIHRAVFLILPLLMISSYGFLKIIHKFSKLKINYLIFALLLLEFIYFWNQYSAHTASWRSFLRNDGSKQLVEYLLKNQNKYEKVLMPVYGTLPIYYLFYATDFTPQLAGKFKLNLIIDKIDRVEFIKDWCPSKIVEKDRLRGSILIVDQGDCEMEEKLEEIEVIYRKDSTKAFRLLISADLN